MNTDRLFALIKRHLEGQISRRELNLLLEEEARTLPLLPQALCPADVLFAETAVAHVTAPCGQGYDKEELKTFLRAALSGEISFYQSIRLEKEHLEERDLALLAYAETLLSGKASPFLRDNVRWELVPRKTAKDALYCDLSYTLFLAASDKRSRLLGIKRQDVLAKTERLSAVFSGKEVGLFAVTPSFICPL